MSHYTTIKTKIRDRDSLVSALRDLYPDAQIDVGAQLTINGYRGRETEIAQVAVRAAGAYRTDIGFRLAADGTYERIADAYTSIDRLAQRYGYHATIANARRLGFRVTHEDTINQSATVAQPIGR